MTESEALAELNRLLQLPSENETVEFKEAKTAFDLSKLGKYFSALSNEACLKGKPFAWLVFGISNNRTIIGSSFRSNAKDLQNLKSEIAARTTNDLTFIEIHEVETENSRVVMFQIPAAPQGIPIAWEGHYYGRNGEELCPLNIDELEKIRSPMIRDDWSAKICSAATISDLDSLAIQKARANFKVKNQRIKDEIDSWNDITFLNKAKLTINGSITKAAIVLLGKPESVHHIAPALAQITWVLKDKEGIEKDYSHFAPPFLLTVDELYSKIRNLKYRYIASNTLFPEEVDQYDPYSIREALCNCIAHQDYTLGGRISVVEKEDGYLFFNNKGSFLPGTIDNVIQNDSPPEFYRNQFLAQAMVNLNMIDTIGSGIKRIYNAQRKKFFPLPDYDFSNNGVKATITGKILDMDFARVLAENPDLSLKEIITLDKVTKKKTLDDLEVDLLKKKGLIEGRKPNYHISQKVAEEVNQRAEYIKNRGFIDQYYKDLILKYIDSYGACTKPDIQKLIFDSLPAVLNEKQKRIKIKNLIQSMSRVEKTIENQGTHKKSIWVRAKKQSK